MVSGELYVASTLEKMAQEYLVAWMRDNVMTAEHREQINSCKLD
jgi:hypothetical protein